MQKLNFNHLFYFQTIARLGSIKQACEVLNLTQPTLSDQLRQLEESLGAKLFDRKNRRLILNSKGELALKYANQIFTLSRDLVRTLKSDALTAPKPIEVGIVPSLSKNFAHKLLTPFLEDNNFKLRIKEESLKHLLQDLSLQNIDVVLSDYHLTSPNKDLKSTMVGATKYFAVSGKKHSKLKKNFPDSLEGQPLFHYTNESPLRLDIDYFFETKNIHFNIVGEADDLNFIRAAAIQQNGVAILPDMAIEDLVKDKKLYILGELNGLKSSVWAIYNKNTEDFSITDFIKKIKP